MLDIWNICKNYEVKGRSVEILNDIEIKVEEGTFLAIIGTSGCGKSTLLRIVSGLEKPTSGRVFYNGKDLYGPNPDWGMVFQDHALLPWRTVLKNVELGLELRKIPKAKRRELATQCIEQVGLGGHLAKYPQELSGGMKRRVSLARTFVTKPQVLLMDEPFAALDAQTKMAMQESLLKMWSIEKPIVLFVTHDVDEAVFLADKICVLSSSPGHVKEIIENTLPRGEDCSRDRHSPEFRALDERVFGLIDKGW